MLLDSKMSRMWVTQYNYDMDAENEVSLDITEEGIIIDCVGGTDVIKIKREQLPELCGLLYREICNEH